MKAKWILTKRHVAAVLLAGTLLGSWMLGADNKDHPVTASKDQIDNHISQYSGSGVPPESLVEKDQVEVLLSERVYTVRSVLSGGTAGLLLGMIFLPVVNLILAWKPRKKTETS